MSLFGSFGSGWFEPKKVPVQTEHGIEEKSPEHREAALRNQMSETLRTQLPAPVQPKKVEIKPPQGWTHGQDGFTFEQRYEQRHVDNIVESVYRGKLSRNRGLLQVFRYNRDTSDLNQLESTLDELMQRRQSLVVDDSDFPELIARIHDVKMKIKELKKQASVHEDSETLLDESFNGEPDSDDYKHWAEGFMKSCIVEVDKVSGHKKPQSDALNEHEESEGENNESEE